MKRNQQLDTISLTPLHYFWIKSSPGLVGNTLKDKPSQQQGQERKAINSLAAIPTPRFFDYAQ